MTRLVYKEAQPTIARFVSTIVLLVSALAVAGCDGERGPEDGVVINNIVLPTDVVLNLACENVGIHPETCVLDDPENPFNSIPPGPGGAKARFYLWATALARRPSGENQFYAALALHELFDANSNVLDQDELVREQALKAYRSVLDNFFGSVTVFTCCAEVRPPDQPNEPIAFAIPLNELTADNLYRSDATGFRRLVPGDSILVLELLLDWGYTYQPASPPNFNDGVIAPGEF